ncbi:MAG: hypothetical protein AAGB16_08465 [Pseudomonadota bacterium]
MKLTLSLLIWASWLLFGFLLTADDYMAGEWSNPDGLTPFPKAELLLRATIFTAALFLFLRF